MCLNISCLFWVDAVFYASTWISRDIKEGPRTDHTKLMCENRPRLTLRHIFVSSISLYLLSTTIIVYVILERTRDLIFKLAFSDFTFQWKLRFQAQYLIFEKMREEGYVSGTEDVRLTIEILVPSAQVGRIIGKGGQNVRELQRVTGSVIKLSEQQTTPPSADEETTVHIVGPFFSVQVKELTPKKLLRTTRIFKCKLCRFNITSNKKNLSGLIFWR